MSEIYNNRYKKYLELNSVKGSEGSINREGDADEKEASH